MAGAEEPEERASNSAKFPKYGWKVKLDHEFPERRDQHLQPSPSQVKIRSIILNTTTTLSTMTNTTTVTTTTRWCSCSPWASATPGGGPPSCARARNLSLTSSGRDIVGGDEQTNLLVPLVLCRQMYGAPCGGLGGGTIGRGFRGEFCRCHLIPHLFHSSLSIPRFQVVPGIYEYHSVPADQFLVSIHGAGGGEALYQSVLGGRGGREKGAPASWQWLGRGEDSLYCALYPRAWTVYNIPQVGAPPSSWS